MFTSGYKFAGLQGDWCSCGKSYDQYQEVEGTKCNRTCTGDPSQICGGPMQSSIYQTGDYLGCFVDQMNRDLPFTPSPNEDGNNVAWCIYTCKTHGKLS